MKSPILAGTLALAALAFGGTQSMAGTAFLEITVKVATADRAAAAAVYQHYRDPFLTSVPGALSKQLLVRDADVQVLHGFDTVENAEAYLTSPLFTDDVVRELGPLLEGDPEIRIYSAD